MALMLSTSLESLKRAPDTSDVAAQRRASEGQGGGAPQLAIVARGALLPDRLDLEHTHPRLAVPLATAADAVTRRAGQPP
jgi:hypothetical protein